MIPLNCAEIGLRKLFWLAVGTLDGMYDVTSVHNGFQIYLKDGDHYIAAKRVYRDDIAWANGKTWAQIKTMRRAKQAVN